MSKNETSLSAVYLTIPLIRVHGSVYCKIFFQSPANECRRHISILTLCTLSVDQKVTHLFVLLICLFY